MGTEAAGSFQSSRWLRRAPRPDTGATTPWREAYAHGWLVVVPTAGALFTLLVLRDVGAARLRGLVPIGATLSIVCLLAAALLLVSRAVADHDPRLEWFATGYAVAALLTLLGLLSTSAETTRPAQGVHGLASGLGGGPLGTSENGVSALSLLVALAVAVTGVAATFWPRAGRPARAAVATALVVAGAWAALSGPALPSFVRADGSLTAGHIVSSVGVLAVSVLAAVALARAAGPHPGWPLRWPLILLVVQCWGLTMRAASRTRFDVAWWSAGALFLLGSVVLLIGLLAGLVSLIRSLEGFAEQLAGGLGTEVRRAASDLGVAEEFVPGETRGLVVAPRRSWDGGGPRRTAVPRTVRTVQDLMRGRELEIVLQPVVDLVGGATIGLEALSRFHGSPSVTPTAFFGAANDAGVGVELELLAARQALTMLDLLPADAWLAVNVSPATATTPELAAMLAKSDCHRLVLELTEHVPVEEYDELVAALARLREQGARVAVDDAGAGFASFRHVVRLRPDVVKLDMSLTAGIDTDPIRRALVASLLTFARSIGALVIAEGIETRRELDVLTVLGVPYGQGHLLGRPRALPEALVVTLPRDEPVVL